MARGDASNAHARRDRWVDQDLIVKLGREGVSGADVVRAHIAAGHGRIALATVYSTWHRHGVEPRKTRHDDAIPWVLREGHSGSYLAQMLRAYAREQNGQGNTPGVQTRLDRFKKARERENNVVHYDPEDTRAKDGWLYTDRREGIDTGLIRNPWFTDRGARIPRPAGLRAGAKPPWSDDDEEPSRVIDLRDRARSRV